MNNTFNITSPLFSQQERQQVQQLLQKFEPQQLQWLAGYLTGLDHANKQLLALLNQFPGIQETLEMPAVQQSNSHSAPIQNITILYGSKSGNSKGIAKTLYEKLQAVSLPVLLQDMNQYDVARLKEEKYLLVIVSTHGEGDPPPAAEDVYSFIHNRKAPKLPGINFAVLALGDKSYAGFCQTGKDFDNRLAELGAKRILNRMDADVEFETTAEEWIDTVASRLQKELNTSTNNSTQPASTPALIVTKTSSNKENKTTYNRKNPFAATILEKVQLNGRGSGKQTWHIELSLEGSGITYQPGDTIGIYCNNDIALVNDVINYTNWNPGELIKYKDDFTSLQALLHQHIELTTVSGVLLQNIANWARSKNKVGTVDLLENILSDKSELTSYVYGRDVLDILKEFELSLPAGEFIEIALPLQPRLYSIASSLQEHEDEVHVTIGLVQYAFNDDRLRKGACSNYVATQLNPGETVKVFFEKNESFRLPENDDKPVIMVGPGTGIAPFRAFVEDRSARGAKGKNWLFFGDRNFSTDFLYQTEWQRYLKQGTLTKMNTAFSRDTSEKVYVQHRLLQHAPQLYDWINNDAYIYVCGDARHMAKDVKKTFIQIIAEQGKLTDQEAEQHLKILVKTGRYCEDVY